MKNTVSATELARNIGDILARVRYRRESFVVEHNGRPVAPIEPAETGATGTVRDALAAWLANRTGDVTFADDILRINAADRPAADPWES